jgi:hypothetical protein
MAACVGDLVLGRVLCVGPCAAVFCSVTECACVGLYGCWTERVFVYTCCVVMTVLSGMKLYNDQRNVQVFN